MMTEREMMLKKLSSYDFAATELHIYLDTHPDDNSAADAFRYYEVQSKKLRQEFEKQYGPLSPGNKNGNRWAWIADPWPWDNQEG